VATVAVLVTALGVALLAALLPRGFAIASPPDWFWIALLLLVAPASIGFAAFSRRSARPRSRPATREAPGARVHAEAVEVSKPEMPSPAPVEDDIDAFLAKLEAEGPFAPVPPAASAALDEDDSASEISELMEWIDGVEDQVSEWAAIAASLDEPLVADAPAEDEPEYEPESGPESWRPVLVTAGGEEEPTETRAGRWSEPRARSAVERYLRLKPWAPATHVAEALDMDLGLAIRIVESVRRSMSV